LPAVVGGEERTVERAIHEPVLAAGEPNRHIGPVHHADRRRTHAHERIRGHAYGDGTKRVEALAVSPCINGALVL
jgi:hypothetical protein